MDKDSGLLNAKNMLENKNLDAVCLNFVSEHGFGSDTNAITLITKDDEVDLGVATKLDISLKLIDNLSKSSKEC